MHNVTVDECAIDKKEKSCKLVRGSTYNMIMSFTPDFDGSDLKVLAYTKVVNEDASLPGMDGDACKLMECPVSSGVPHEYHFNLPISFTLPRGTFRTQWRMTQNDVPRCCFENKFKIV